MIRSSTRRPISPSGRRRRIARLTTIYNFGDVVRVPFPFIERNILRHRPALVVSWPFSGIDTPLFYVLMITSAAHRAWPDDISLADDYADYGLAQPSLVRVAKIAAIAGSDATVIGRLYGVKLARVAVALRAATTPPA